MSAAQALTTCSALGTSPLQPPHTLLPWMASEPPRLTCYLGLPLLAGVQQVLGI